MDINIVIEPARRSGFSGFVNGEQIAVGTLSSVAKSVSDEVKALINKFQPSIQEDGGV